MKVIKNVFAHFFPAESQNYAFMYSFCKFHFEKPTTSLKYEMTQPTFGVVSCA